MPRSYISVKLDKQIRERAKNRCAYCLSPQHLVMGKLEIEHIHPVSKGGGNEEENLTLSCRICNGHKGDKTTAVDPETEEVMPLFNPNTQNWFEHFKWSEDGVQVIGLTPVGRATVQALHLDIDKEAINVRERWVSVGWHPPQE